jgi:hypothetical protein
MRGFALVLTAGVLAGCHATTEVRGIYVGDDREGTFFPCDDPTIIVRVPDSALAATYRRMADAPHQPVYVQLRGVRGHAGSIYGGPRYFLVQRVLEIRARRIGECPKVARPVAPVFPSASNGQPTQSLQTDSSWDQADRLTRRLAPAAYPALPPGVRADLERRGCAIPQTTFDSHPHNVIRGHFRTPDQLDWAVLCSVERVSTILVYWAGRADSVDELAPEPDKNFLQGWHADSIVFSRSIAPADPTYIREHAARYGGEATPVPIHHEGIDDGFAGKGSVVRYWHLGKWLELTGAD